MRKPVNESHIEKRVCDHAKRNGWQVFKFSSPAQRGVPDRIFLKSKRIWFVEFKASGKRPTKQQIATHDRIKAEGFRVFIIDDVESGKELFNA